MRYVRYLEALDKPAAKAALDRAVLVYCKRRPEAHLFAASFDERAGDVEGARTRYKHILDVLCPRLLEGITAAANFERRQVGWGSYVCGGFVCVLHVGCCFCVMCGGALPWGCSVCAWGLLLVCHVCVGRRTSR
jgi:hypothetical protein